MNQRFLLSVIFVLIAKLCFCQKLDFERIKKETSDSTSIYYFPRLIDFINSNPNEISDSLLLYLYYGKIFQRETKYSPSEKYYIKVLSSVDKGECETAINIGEDVLKTNPTYIAILLGLSRCYENQGSYEKAAICKNRAIRLMSIITHLFSGKTKEDAIILASVGDQYAFLNYLNLTVKNRQNEGSKYGTYDIWESIYKHETSKIYFLIR